MPPKQATLGKFFGKPDGSKPVTQQSKLAFSTKPPKKEKIEADEQIEERATVEDLAVNGTGKPEMKDVPIEEGQPMDEDGMASDSGSDVPVAATRRKSKASNSSPANRKRHVTSVDEDDQLRPSKRTRTSTQSKRDSSKPTSRGKKTPKSKVEGVVPEEDAAKVQNDSDEPDSQDRNPSVESVEGVTTAAKKTKKSEKPKTARTSSGKTSKSNEESKDNVKSKTSRAKVLPQASKKEPENGEPDVGSESASEVESSEDDSPEATVKSQEKLKTVAKGSGKDLYPDWKAGEPVPYAALCTTFSKIEMTTKRLEMTAYCSKFFQQVLRLTPKDLELAVLLMTNKLAADYTGIELGIGESLIMKAIGESTGRSLSIIKADQKEIGDLGLVAAKSRSNQPTMFKPKPLTIRGVHDAMMLIAQTEGKGTQERKVGGIKKLLSAADPHLASKGSKGVDITENKGGPSESKFIVRMLEGKLRLGLAEKSVLVALSQAMVMHESRAASNKEPGGQKLAEGEKVLKSVYSELPSYEVIIPAMLEHGIMNLKEHCKLRPGVPLKPMLAKPTKSITEVLDRFEGKSFSCEYKYDGERAQIHYVAKDSDEKFATAAPSAGKTDGCISNIFSRNSEDLSMKYPDTLQRLPAWVLDNTKSFVLDCETVAWDVKEKKVLPFQQLMTRKRKDVKAEDITVQVCVFAFDLLYLNGEALVNKAFRERREMLRGAFNEVEGEFKFAQYGDTNELDEIQVLLEDSVKASCEGLMVKMLDGAESSYEPSKRSQNWLKVKKDYLSGVGDSLDLVVLGAYFGRGKRTSWYGAFLLACYNPSTQNYETVCNIGTGFSEAILEEFHTTLSGHTIERAKPFYSHSAGNKDQPDVWFEPKFVWEVKTADLTLSPRYKAAADQLTGSGGKGISLRFPRFVKVRDDKKPEQATSSRQVAEMYQNQESVSKSKGPAADDDFEY